MTIRRRLVLVVALAALALATAIGSILHLLSRTESARRSAAETTLTRSADSLARSFASSRSLAPSLAGADRAAMDAFSEKAALPFADTFAGYCGRDGNLYTEVGSRGPEIGKRQPLPPDQREAVAALCRETGAGQTKHGELAHPHDVILLLARSVADDGSAWTLTRVPYAEEENKWKIELGLLAAVTLALVVVTLSTAAAVGRDVRALEASLSTLEGDLRAPLSDPTTSEFARVTKGLRRMAMHLADAQDHERDQLHARSHQERLAALGRVAAGLAHEIRNPLAGIKLKLDVLTRSESVVLPVKSDLRICIDEIQRLDRFVQALLTVARKSERTTERIDVATLVDERMALLQTDASGQRVSLRREGAASVVADVDDLTRVVDNLLRNAIESSPADADVVAVIRGTAANVQIQVRDSGPGVATSRVNEIFEPFFTTKPEGTGLGLWLSRALVEARGGDLSYTRTADRTTFTVTLPADTAATATATATPKEPS